MVGLVGRFGYTDKNVLLFAKHREHIYEVHGRPRSSTSPDRAGPRSYGTARYSQCRFSLRYLCRPKTVTTMIEHFRYTTLLVA